jgi:hypothetical protein
MYPSPGRTAVGAGFPADHIPADASAETIRARIREANAELFEADEAAAGFIADADEFSPWPMTDLRTHQWSKGRIALCADAISVRLDDAAQRALMVLEASGLSRSEAIRSALVDAAGRLRERSTLAAEVATLEADEADRDEMLAVAELMESLRAPG